MPRYRSIGCHCARCIRIGKNGATGQLVLDSAGNLYGTTAVGGAYGYGVIWEITP